MRRLRLTSRPCTNGARLSPFRAADHNTVSLLSLSLSLSRSPFSLFSSHSPRSSFSSPYPSLRTLSLFTPVDQDLAAWPEKGYGNRLSYQIASPLLQEMVSIWDDVISGAEPDQLAFFRFAHAETVPCFVLDFLAPFSLC